MGRKIEYKILFECLNPGCKIRYSLDLCREGKMFHHCELHDFNLNSVRDMFGKYNCILTNLDFVGENR